MENESTEKELISYNTDTEQEIKLSPNIVFKYFAKGEITKQEAVMFMMLCKYQKLNPWLGDAYLVKYGTQPAQLLTHYNVLIRKAQQNPAYRMHRSGIIIKANNKIEYRDGAFYDKENEVLLGGWCKLYIDDKEHSTTVSLSEYEQRKSDGTLNVFWKIKPGMMIEKCAISKIFRQYIEGLESMRLPEEMPQNDYESPEETQPDKAKEAMQSLNVINCEPSLKIQIGKLINEYKNNDEKLDIIITYIGSDKLKSVSFINDLKLALKGEKNGE